METPEHSRAEEVRAFWLYLGALCEGGVPPRAAKLDLMDIYRLAPNVTILDFEKSSGKLKVRFNGTAVVTMFGREATGRYKDDLKLGRHSKSLKDIYKRTVTECRPYWVLASVELQTETGGDAGCERVFDYERLSFPLVDDNGQVVSVAAILIRHPFGTAIDGFECAALDFPNAVIGTNAAYS